MPVTLLTLGLWLGRSIIVPIKSHRPQSCRLHCNADISRSYSFSSRKKDEVEAKPSSWRIRVEKGNRRKTVITCVLIAAGITAFYITTRLILQNFIPKIAARPFFKTYIDVKLRKIYLFAVIVQELLSKGVLQHGMEKALPKEKYKTAILVTAAIFGMLHIHTSPYYILGAMGLAVVSGIIYHKQGNIWASVTLHFFLAFLPRCFGLK